MKKGMIELMVVVLGVIVAVPSTAQSPYSKAIFQAGKNTVVAHAPKRVLGGPYVTTRLKGEPREPLANKSEITVKLKAGLPSKLRVKDTKINWTVKSNGSNGSRSGKGKNTSFNLKPGKYKVRMSIGQFVKTSRTIQVKTNRNRTQSFILQVKAGRLITEVASKDEVVSVLDSRGKLIVRSNSQGYLTKVLPIGNYTIKSKSRGRNKLVNVSNGKVVTARFKASKKGTVEVRAVVNGSSILPRGTRIKIYSKQGEEIKSVLRGTLRSHLAPGEYDAALTIKGVEKTRKRFRIVNRKTQSVILKM